MNLLLVVVVTAVVGLVSPALAQTPVPLVSPTPLADYSDEGLTDDDVQEGAAAEVLPTEGLAYRWERLRHGLRRAFVFNAAKKAELDREFLHRLDRKLTACAQLGDEACMARVKEHMAAAQERAEKHLEKREELRAQHLERFQVWRERRETRLEELRDQAGERREQRTELLQQRQENIKELRQQHQERRQERLEQLQQQRLERQDTQLERRSEVREQRQDIRQELRTTAQQRLGAPREELRPARVITPVPIETQQTASPL